MPKIRPLGQKLWPTGREHTDRQTEKANTEDPFFRFFLNFRFSFKGAVRYSKTIKKNLRIAISRSKKSKFSFTNHNMVRYLAKSPLLLQSTLKGNNCLHGVKSACFVCME